LARVELLMAALHVRGTGINICPGREHHRRRSLKKSPPSAQN
jgi:hypothetical protein